MFDREVLVESIATKMPFGKYKGVSICDLPLFYLEWFLNKDGFPKGKIGDMMSIIYQIKLNGLDNIIEKLKNNNN